MSSVPASSNLRLDIMTPFLPDVRKRTFGVSSPESPIEQLGYNCAYPSWPNRRCLDSRSGSSSTVTSVASSACASAATHSAPAPIMDANFMEKLRKMPRPDECFEEEDSDLEDEDEQPLPARPTSSNFTFGSRSPIPPTPPPNCSLLSRALSGARRPPIRQMTT